MKAMILVLSSRECANLINGDLSILVRKKFPKDFVGWVYIYCTKEELYLFLNDLDKKYYCVSKSLQAVKDSAMNSKVVARFWCDKVERVWKTTTNIWTYGSDLEPDFYKESCLNDIELDRYFKPTKVGFGKVYGYAIHITKLEVFDKPKELWQFKTPYMAERYKFDLEKAREDDYEIGTRIAERIANDDEIDNCVELTEMSEPYYGLQRAPRNGWCYIQV